MWHTYGSPQIWSSDNRGGSSDEAFAHRLTGHAPEMPWIML